jgi:hypothetical protein
MHKTRDIRKQATLFKATEEALQSKREDPRWRLRYSLCITLRRCTESIGNVCALGSLKDVEASCLARACEATHENIDSPSLRGGRPKRNAVSDEASPKEEKAT